MTTLHPLLQPTFDYNKFPITSTFVGQRKWFDLSNVGVIGVFSFESIAKRECKLSSN